MATGTYDDLLHDTEETTEAATPILLTAQAVNEEIVVLSSQDLRDWEDLINLLNNPTNAERLVRSLRAANAKQAVARHLSLAKPVTMH